jgi:hypothetical protein
LAAWVWNALINVAFAVIAVLLAAHWIGPRRRGLWQRRGR